jgi:predicted RNase H-like nuclease
MDPRGVMRVTGIDGCRVGWVAVTLTAPVATPRGGTTPTATPRNASALAVTVAVAQDLDELRLAGTVGIDMPLGLLVGGWRSADLLARRALGRRGCCVFAIPPRPVWAENVYADANRRCRELTGGGMSAQAWGLRAKLLEADRYRRATRHPLHEVHPELAFAAMAGGPLPDSKHSPAGLTARHALLKTAGITLPAAPPRGVGEDDLLDAAAVAWSARRIAAGTAEVLSDPAQRADDGAEIAIRY